MKIISEKSKITRRKYMQAYYHRPYVTAKMKARSAASRRHTRYKEIHRWQVLKFKYGISREQYESMLVDQKGLCKLCHLPANESRPLSVDHCHVTKRIRGLIHHTCNSGLGMFNDSIIKLTQAIDYLRKEGEF